MKAETMTFFRTGMRYAAKSAPPDGGSTVRSAIGAVHDRFSHLLRPWPRPGLLRKQANAGPPSAFGINLAWVKYGAMQMPDVPFSHRL